MKLANIANIYLEKVTRNGICWSLDRKIIAKIGWQQSTKSLTPGIMRLSPAPIWSKNQKAHNFLKTLTLDLNFQPNLKNYTAIMYKVGNFVYDTTKSNE